MIQNKKEYLYYLEQDKLSLGIKDDNYSIVKRILIKNDIWVFQKTLRKAEYYKNCKKGFLNRILYILIKLKLNKLSVKLGFSIPENVFGPGLCIVHRGTIVVNANAKIGKNCRIHVCTNLGASGGELEAPKIGDNVYIAPGVKIYGNIHIVSNIAFAANAAVGKDCLIENSMYGGVPAKWIKEIKIDSIIKHIG